MPLRIPHSISYYCLTSRRWAPVTSHAVPRPRAQGSDNATAPKHHLDGVSWNIDYSSAQPSRRCLALINHVLEGGVPDIICLQEVTPVPRAAILGSPEVRDAFLATDAGPGAEEKIFENMTLLSKKRFAYDGPDAAANGPKGEEDKLKIGQVFREQTPTAMDREGLCVDLVPAGAHDSFVRVVNVHLESLDSLPYRAAQLKRLASALREPGCGGRLIVGDFNAITEEDDGLLRENGLQDAWLTLHGGAGKPGATWNVSRRDFRFEPARLDKVAVVGLVPDSMEIMHPLFVEAPRPGAASAKVEWSDHSGLRCKFQI
ncbi:hypothetical protein RB595_006122 [Gaeumannomyces hyphopodioides]